MTTYHVCGLPKLLDMTDHKYDFLKDKSKCKYLLRQYDGNGELISLYYITSEATGRFYTRLVLVEDICKHLQLELRLRGFKLYELSNAQISTMSDDNFPNYNFMNCIPPNIAQSVIVDAGYGW